MYGLGLCQGGLMPAVTAPDNSPGGQVVRARGTKAESARPGAALAAIAPAQLLVVLDATIVYVALPHVQRALGFSGTSLEWVVYAYAVTFGGLLLARTWLAKAPHGSREEEASQFPCPYSGSVSRLREPRVRGGIAGQVPHRAAAPEPVAKAQCSLHGSRCLGNLFVAG
jgi:hypothetical protein